MSITSRLGRLLGRGSGSESGGGSRITVAAFGKHPGWDDHIEDIGLSTDSLIAVKRWLYVEGIRTVIDGGAWEKLRKQEAGTGENKTDGAEQAAESEPRASDSSPPIIEIAHVFLYRYKSDVIVGRMWASRDGKNRTQYPMIVCAHCRGLSSDAALALVAPALERLEQKCKATETAQGVRDAVAGAQRELELSEGATTEQSGTDGDPPLSILAARTELGPDRVGLHRILYQIEREMSAFRAIKGGSTTEFSRSSSTSSRARHMRVPVCAGSPLEGIRLWLGLMHGRDLKGGQISAASPMFVLAPLEHGWIDLIVGVPTDAELYCIRAGVSALALTSDVPYTIDPSFIDQAERTIRGAEKSQAAAGGKVSEVKPAIASRSVETAASGQADQHRSGGRNVARMLVALVLIAALGGAGYFAYQSPFVHDAISSIRAQFVQEPPPPGEVDARTETAEVPTAAPAELERWAASEPREPEHRATETERRPSPRPDPIVTPPEMQPAQRPLDPVPHRDSAALRVALMEHVDRHRLACDEALRTDPLNEFEARVAALDELSGEGRGTDLVETEWRSLVHFVEREQRRLTELVTACDSACEERLKQLVDQTAAEPFESPALRERWQTGIAASIDGGECRQRLRAALSLHAGLTAVQNALPRDAGEQTSPLMAQGAQVIAERRERLLRSVLDEMDWGSDDPAPPAGWDRAFREWRQAALNYAASVEAVRSAMDEARAFREIDPLHPDVDGLAELDDVRLVKNRWAALAALSTSESSPAALTAKSRDKHAAFELRVEAWRRLGALAAEHSLENERAIQELLAALIEQRSAEGRLDSRRAAELAEELRSGARARWIAHAEAAADHDSLALVMTHREHIDVPDDAIENDRLRFNVQLFDRVERVQHASEDETRDRATELLEWVREQPEHLRPDEAWFEHVGRVIEAATLAALPVDRLGPAAAGGWRGEVLDDGRMIRFTVDDHESERSLLFRRVGAAEGAGATYVLTHEVPVWLFAHAVEKAGGWSSLSDLLEEPHTRRGPRGWQVNAQSGRIEIAAQWLDREGSNCYAPRLRPTPPTIHMPAQSVSPAAAAYLAARLGCRLPTVDEWRLALNESGEAEQMARANLRGSAWRTQWTHLSRERLLPCDRPHEGVFFPTDLKINSPEAVWIVGGKPRADDTLWFREVEISGEGGAYGEFRDLIGNVSEFVVDDAAAFDALVVDPEAVAAAQITNLLLQASEKAPAIIVIGGSSLSHPSVRPDEAHPVPLESVQAMQSYSDVGFRLAFSVSSAARPSPTAGGGSE